MLLGPSFHRREFQEQLSDSCSEKRFLKVCEGKASPGAQPVGCSRSSAPPVPAQVEQI